MTSDFRLIEWVFDPTQFLINQNRYSFIHHFVFAFITDTEQGGKCFVW